MQRTDFTATKENVVNNGNKLNEDVRSNCAAKVNETLLARGLQTLSEEQFNHAAQRLQPLYF